VISDKVIKFKWELVKIKMSRDKDLSPYIPPLKPIFESKLFRRRADSKEQLGDYYDFEDVDYELDQTTISQNQQHQASRYDATSS
jgi:hypothetical protein